MWGNRTTFFNGRRGSWRLVAAAPVTVPKDVLGRLLGRDLLELFFRVHLGLVAEVDRLLRDDASLDLRACRNFEQGVQEDVFDDAVQPGRPGSPLPSILGNCGQGRRLQDKM